MEQKPSQADLSPEHQMRPVLELLQGGEPQVICTKYGINREELDKRLVAYQASLRQTVLMDNLTTKRAGRNEPCPCGSGKKYKKCCLPQHEEARKNLSQDQLREMEERTKAREKLDIEVKKGFDLMYKQDFSKARQHAVRMLETFPEDDRLHEMLVTCLLAAGDYDSAFHTSRRRWQVAQEEKDFLQEHGHHKREGEDRKEFVHFYSPSTWLESFWIAQRARIHRDMFPADESSPTVKLAERLKLANDVDRFSNRQEDGYEQRRLALAPVLAELQALGPAAIPYLLPLAYYFSWAGLFVPELLEEYGTDASIRLLAELSMFRFPYFSQKCLLALEEFGERAVNPIQQILESDPSFDELKVGMVMVLGGIRTRESFDLLLKLTEHENPFLVNCAIQALARQENPEALPYVEKAKERLASMSKIAGAIRDLAPASVD